MGSDGFGWGHDADSLTRTDDLPLTRRLLYQLSYAGTEAALSQVRAFLVCVITGALIPAMD